MMTSYRRNRKSTPSSIPKFIENLRGVNNIREGETVSLDCRVEGFPRPEVQWERNGRLVPKSRNVYLERIGDRCVLRIKSCQAKDEGHYNCIASNIMGTATSRSILHVLSEFKDSCEYRSGALDVTSEKEMSPERKGVSGIKNSRITVKTPYSTKFKPKLICASKPEDPKTEKVVKTSLNTNINRLSSSQKSNCFSPGNLQRNYVTETPRKFVTQAKEKVDQVVTRYTPLKIRETLRSSQLTQSKAPSKLTNTSACGRDRFSVQVKDAKHASRSLKNIFAKEEKKVVDVNIRRLVTNKNDNVKEKKDGVKKEVVKNKPIVRDKILPKTLNKKIEAKLKNGDYQKSVVLPNERRRAVMLTRQRKLEEADSLEEQSSIPHVTSSLSRASDHKRHNETEVLRLNDTSKSAKITDGPTVFSNVTNDSCETDKKRTDFSFKVNSWKQKDVKNGSHENRIVPDFTSSKNSSMQSNLKGHKSSKSANDSNTNSKLKNVSNAENILSDKNKRVLVSSNCHSKILNDSKKSKPVRQGNFSSNLQSNSCVATKLQSDTLNKKMSDSRANIKLKINHTTSKRLNDINKSSVVRKSDSSDNSGKYVDLKGARDCDHLVEPHYELVERGSNRISRISDAMKTHDDDNATEDSNTNEVQNGREKISYISQDCNVCPCIHKVFGTTSNCRTKSNAVSKLSNDDKTVVVSILEMSNNVGEEYTVSTTDESQNHSKEIANQNGWKHNKEHKRISPILHDMHCLNENDWLSGQQDPSAQLNCSASDTRKSPKDVPVVEKYGISQIQSDQILRTKFSKIDSSPTVAPNRCTIGPQHHSDGNFLEERLFRYGEKAVGHLTKEPCEQEENQTLININPVVTPFLNSLTKKKLNEDLETFLPETETSDIFTEQNVVKNDNLGKTDRCRNRSAFDTRTCKGNVRLNSDVIEEECEFFIPEIPEAEAEQDTQQVESQKDFPVRIVKGPQSVTVLRGESVTLAVHFQGTPQPLVTWARGGTKLRSDGRVSILVGRDMSVLTVSDVTADDSGKYVVSVENSGGGDSCFASMAVVGIPEPPGGQPTASDVTDHSLVLSWYGSMYDGGSVVTGYVIEMSTLPERRWHRVSNCVNTSHVIQGLSNGQHYVFRVRAENRYGLSQPSRESEAICLEDSSSCEDWEVPRRDVKVEAGSQFSEQFELKEEVGKGRFGTVYRCIERTSGRPRAAKVIRCIKAKDKEKVQQEISVMNKLHHPKLMQILAAFESGKNMIMVMEFISGGELFERVIADDFVLTEHDCVLFMRQICDGVAYMHKCSVLHLDLKPENILCKTRTCHQIKIIDFGLARVYNPEENLRILFGTPEFVAPEVINYEPVGPPSDMWSVGVICYVLLSGLSPFMGESDPETFANITRGEMDFDDEAFDTISEDAKNFISFLLVKKPKDRMTAEVCLEHCWLAAAGWKASDVPLSTEKLKRFIVRRKWQKTGTAIRALGRMVSLSRSSLGLSSGTPSPVGSPKIFRSQSEISRSETSESGFSEFCSDSNSVSELIT